MHLVRRLKTALLLLRLWNLCDAMQAGEAGLEAECGRNGPASESMRIVLKIPPAVKRVKLRVMESERRTADNSSMLHLLATVVPLTRPLCKPNLRAAELCKPTGRALSPLSASESTIGVWKGTERLEE